ncbi:Unknown protein [Striga hermonthica]|uniref:Myb-like protein X n=1 Tax=Striga hermonthica TaxID=68872 RepID=A0A9N7RPE1_STRHE|nr:Unknown protein [Striga hermonthica]
MSRCFPFPPPGYERKHRSEGLDLLTEAKCKEKKHKKEKKDKERKKERENEREGSSAKHRDKKDRKKKSKEKKEKHKEKKDRGKDKDKSSISEESTVARNEGIIAENLYPVEYSKESKNFGNEGKCPARLQDQNDGKPSQSSLPSLGNEESKFVQELDRRVRDEKSRGSQLPEKLAFMAEKDRPMLNNASGVLIEKKDGNKNKRDPGNFKNEVSGNMMVQKLMPIGKSKGEGIPRPMNAENGWRLEDKEKYKETAGRKPGDKPNDTGKEIHVKDKNNETKKYDEANIRNENKKGSRQGKLEDEGRDYLGGCDGHKSTGVLNGYNINTVNEENIKKRKDMATNGFLHERETRPIKMQRSSHQSTENGRQLEPPQTLAKSSNDNQAVPNNVEVDNNERLTNGTFEAQKPSSSIPNPHAATVQIVEVSKLPQCDSNTAVVTAEASRSPHPDSKYLAEVLTVPKNMSDWSENDDDQLWLFSDRVPRKPKLDSFELDDDVHVWSEAVHIESADICALPYVVPY